MEEEYKRYCEYCELNNFNSVTFNVFKKRLTLSPKSYYKKIEIDKFFYIDRKCLNDFLQTIPKENKFILCRKLYNDYVAWCRSLGTRQPLPIGTFSRKITVKFGPSCVKLIENKFQRCYQI